MHETEKAWLLDVGEKQPVWIPKSMREFDDGCCNIERPGVVQVNIPRPLHKGKLCKACGGTGANAQMTLKLSHHEGYIMCRECNGNGLDPTEYFRWGDHKPLPQNGE